MRPSEFLLAMRRTIRLYQTVCEPVCARLGLTQTELDVLGFLGNNPSLDTAKDIVELRMLPKANVSQAVSSLLRKELLWRRRDGDDRRWAHLGLTPRGEDLLPEINAARREMAEALLAGFSREEREQYLSLYLRMADNARAYLKKRG